MAEGYTEDELRNKMTQYQEDIQHFYQKDIVNYRGRTLDTERYYTEVIAEWCLSHLTEFDRIPVISRKKGYAVEHKNETENVESNRVEEIIAKKMAGGSLPKCGKIIDYQVPLKDKQSDQAGKIDLLAFDGKTLRILELKKPLSKETMLRCVLEGLTYLKVVDRKRLKESYEGISRNIELVACPLVEEKSVQASEYLSEDRPYLHQLMEKVHSEPIFYDGTHYR